MQFDDSDVYMIGQGMFCSLKGREEVANCLEATCFKSIILGFHARATSHFSPCSVQASTSAAKPWARGHEETRRLVKPGSDNLRFGT
jgi:hypothetical protein